MFIVKIYKEKSDRQLKLFHTSEEAENYVLRKLKGTDKKTIEVFEWDSIALELSYWNRSTRQQESYLLEY
ncbi:hypothetical protein ODGCJCGO_00076 [Enterococcus phage EFKL]|nr:hypothetical protein ODGCJCGO_00076 [Enterococcus phage EFKL]